MARMLYAVEYTIYGNTGILGVIYCIMRLFYCSIVLRYLSM